MPSKRRNNGRSKHGRGHTAIVRCSNCCRCVPKEREGCRGSATAEVGLINEGAKDVVAKSARLWVQVVRDKAIKRFQVRNMVDASSQRDLREASVYQTFMLPKLYMKMLYCSLAVLHGEGGRLVGRRSALAVFQVCPAPSTAEWSACATRSCALRLKARSGCSWVVEGVGSSCHG
ncbi:40S ribosomal protein S26 [Durusdinium trenchii]|uniref:40S ribosomal protein S26 n=1 Tax=Durusdinium trenchii TaxID=1381693 RepID=A0ABP0S755_9DINO